MLQLDHRYHDDDPVQDAPFKATFPNGLVLEGTLDKQGQAKLYGVPSSAVSVQFGPDQRDFERVDETENPDYSDSLSDADIGALFQKYSG